MLTHTFAFLSYGTEWLNNMKSPICTAPGMFLDIKRVNWGDVAANVHAVRTCFCFLLYPLG